MINQRKVLIVPILILFACWVNAREDPGRVWWPSEWGADDERGAANRITPDKVLEATALIKKGKLYELGRVYEPGMPLFPGRHYSLTIPGGPTGGPLGENATVYNDEMVSAQIGQVGTQFDGLGHIGTRLGGEDVYYNGFKGSEFARANGLEKLGMEKVGVFMTRGVLIDVAAYKQVDRLPVGAVISAEDLQGALRKQSVEIHEGDAVLIHTGHGQLWMVDNEQFSSGEPGIGIGAALWLAEKKIVLTAADSWGVEVVPSENPNHAFPVHQELIVKRGIYNLENLYLSELAKDRVYEFAFIFAPVKFKGATGSPGNPIAVR